MVSAPSAPRSSCPINFGLEIFGDRWSLLVLRDVLMTGKTTFREFLASPEGIASNILAERLQRLVACGILAMSPDTADRRIVRYSATKAGKALLPVLVEMAYWGATFDAATGAPATFRAAYDDDRDVLLKSMAQTRT